MCFCNGVYHCSCMCALTRQTRLAHCCIYVKQCHSVLCMRFVLCSHPPCHCANGVDISSSIYSIQHLVVPIFKIPGCSRPFSTHFQHARSNGWRRTISSKVSESIRWTTSLLTAVVVSLSESVTQAATILLFPLRRDNEIKNLRPFLLHFNTILRVRSH